MTFTLTASSISKLENRTREGFGHLFLSRTRNTPFRVRSGSQGEVDNCVGTSAMSGKVFNEKCVVTGEPARYRDPVTGQPYATLAAFKILRQRFVEQVRPPRVPRRGAVSSGPISRWRGWGSACRALCRPWGTLR